MNYVEIDCKLNTKSFESQIQSVERKLNDLIADYQTFSTEDGFNEQSNEAIRLRKEIEKTANELSRLKNKQDEINNQGFEQAKDGLKDIGQSIKSTVTHIAKWALALIGVRSIYNLIRNSMSIISSQDKQLAADIEYMKNAIAYALEPVIRSIVNLAKELMFYVGYIAKAWFGKDIFANANKSLNNATGNAKKLNKELSKTTASFDEMNVLQKSSSADTSAGGVSTPSFDLTKGLQENVPEWLDWLGKHGKEIIAILAGLAGGLAAVKLGLSGIQGLGVGLAITGIVYAIEKIIDFIKDPSFLNFIGILEGIAVAVAGVAIAFAAWPVAIGAAVALVVIEIVKNFNKIMGLFGELEKWLDKNVLGGLRKLFGPLGDILYLPIRQFIGAAKSAFESFYGGIKKMVNGIVSIFKGDFKKGIVQVFSGLKGVMLAPLNAIVGAINGIIKGINNIKIDIPSWVPGIGGKKWGFNIPTIPKLAKGGIINMPGRGVPIAYGGERGQEAVLPLTDSQQMALLGEAIGKYININATVPVYVGNRQIAKEIKKINAESDFAYNR